MPRGYGVKIRAIYAWMSDYNPILEGADYAVIKRLHLVEVLHNLDALDKNAEPVVIGTKLAAVKLNVNKYAKSEGHPLRLIYFKADNVWTVAKAEWATKYGEQRFPTEVKEFTQSKRKVKNAIADDSTLINYLPYEENMQLYNSIVAAAEDKHLLNQLTQNPKAITQDVVRKLSVDSSLKLLEAQVPVNVDMRECVIRTSATSDFCKTAREGFDLQEKNALAQCWGMFFEHQNR